MFPQAPQETMQMLSAAAQAAAILGPYLEMGVSTQNTADKLTLRKDGEQRKHYLCHLFFRHLH